MKIINKKTISVALITVLIIISYFVFFTRDEDSIEVRTMNSYIGDLEKTIKISGTIETLDSEVISLQPSLEVIKTYYNENEYVKKGDLIAELDSDDLKTQLSKAKLNLAQLEKDLQDLKSSSSGSERPLLVNALEKSKANIENINTDLNNAQEDLERNKILLENDAISEKEYETQVNLVEDLKSSLKNAEITYEDAQISLSNYDSSQNKAADKLELQIESAKLDISSIEGDISDRSIYANLDGIITELNLVEGRLTNNSSIISIYNDSSFEFVSLVPQEDAVLIEKNQETEISLDGLSKTYTGYVSKVGKIAEIDPNSGSQTPKVEIRILIDEIDNKIASGYNGDAVISLEKNEDVLLIRNEAIKKDNEGSFVFLVSGDSVEKIYVDTNLSDGYFTSIDSGIEENDEVVLNPPMELNDESSITILD